MSRIKMDYVEGVYRLIKNSSERGRVYDITGQGPGGAGLNSGYHDR